MAAEVAQKAEEAESVRREGGHSLRGRDGAWFFGRSNRLRREVFGVLLFSVQGSDGSESGEKSQRHFPGRMRTRPIGFTPLDDGGQSDLPCEHVKVQVPGCDAESPTCKDIRMHRQCWRCWPCRASAAVCISSLMLTEESPIDVQRWDFKEEATFAPPPATRATQTESDVVQNNHSSVFGPRRGRRATTW